jgi:hypothetical protein
MPKLKQGEHIEPSATSKMAPWDRCKFMREQLGFKKPELFAKHFGITPARWINVENGYPLSRDLALILGQKIPGFSAEWIWTGNDRLLSIEFARLMRLIPPVPAANDHVPVRTKRKRGDR